MGSKSKNGNLFSIRGYVLKRTKTTNRKMVLSILSEYSGKLILFAYQPYNLKKGESLEAYTCYELHMEKRGSAYYLHDFEEKARYTDLIYEPESYELAGFATKLIYKKIPEDFTNDIFGIYDEFLQILNFRLMGLGLIKAYFIIRLLCELGLWPSADNLITNQLFIDTDSDIINVLKHISTSTADQLKGLKLDDELEARVLEVLDAYLKQYL